MNNIEWSTEETENSCLEKKEKVTDKKMERTTISPVKSERPHEQLKYIHQTDKVYVFCTLCKNMYSEISPVLYMVYNRRNVSLINIISSWNKNDGRFYFWGQLLFFLYKS